MLPTSTCNRPDQRAFPGEEVGQGFESLFLRLSAHRRERAVELEALACARLGQLNARVLKDRPRGTEYYRRCIELAQTLHPIPYWKSWHRARALPASLP